MANQELAERLLSILGSKRYDGTGVIHSALGAAGFGSFFDLPFPPQPLNVRVLVGGFGWRTAERTFGAFHVLVDTHFEWQRSRTDKFALICGLLQHGVIEGDNAVFGSVRLIDKRQFHRVLFEGNLSLLAFEDRYSFFALGVPENKLPQHQ